jgi:hypothetical protein
VCASLRCRDPAADVRERLGTTDWAGRLIVDLLAVEAEPRDVELHGFSVLGGLGLRRLCSRILSRETRLTRFLQGVRSVGSTCMLSPVMTWLAWLGLAVLITAAAAITGIKPKGTRHVAHTRLMGVARFALLALVVIFAYLAFRARFGG